MGEKSIDIKVIITGTDFDGTPIENVIEAKKNLIILASDGNGLNIVIDGVFSRLNHAMIIGALRDNFGKEKFDDALKLARIADDDLPEDEQLGILSELLRSAFGHHDKNKEENNDGE